MQAAARFESPFQSLNDRLQSGSVADLEIRPIYVQMALDLDMNPKRPFDVAVKDYYHNGNDLLWKKHFGDRPKPESLW